MPLATQNLDVCSTDTKSVVRELESGTFNILASYINLYVCFPKTDYDWYDQKV